MSGHRVRRGFRVTPLAPREASAWHLALFGFITTAGALGVSSLAIKAWAAKQGYAYSSCQAVLSRAVKNGMLIAERIQAGRPDIGNRNCTVVLYRPKEKPRAVVTEVDDDGPSAA